MIAGAQFRGQFEQRFKAALQEAVDAEEHRAVRRRAAHHPRRGQRRGRDGRRQHAQAPAGPRRAARRRRDHAGRVPQDRARRRAGPPLLAPSMVDEPSVEDTVAILRGLRGAYEEHHGALIDDAALDAAARLCDRYITEYHLPDKAIDLVDQAAREAARRHGPRPSAARALAAAEKQAAVDAEDYEQRRRGSSSELDGRRDGPARRRRARGRRGRRRAHRHPGRGAGRGRAASGCKTRGRPARARGRPGRGRRGRVRHRPPRPRRACPRATARWARSCSSARPASARPSWSRRSRSGCSRPRRRWSGSTCPSTARRTPSRG